MMNERGHRPSVCVVPWMLSATERPSGEMAGSVYAFGGAAIGMTVPSRLTHTSRRSNTPA
jgi:hypothetical protein